MPKSPRTRSRRLPRRGSSPMNISSVFIERPIFASVLAILIAIGWPLDSLVLIGYLVGFQIIACGVARIALGMGARDAAPAPKPGA